jgi:hypothetical protein
MMAKRSAFGVIVATDFIRSSNADLPYPDTDDNAISMETDHAYK